MFYHTLYMRFENVRLTHAFYHPLISLILTNYNPCIELVFLETCTFNTRFSERIFYKTPVLRTLLDVHKTSVNYRMLNMHFSIHALPRVKRTFNVRLKTHVLRMLHILVKVVAKR